MSSRRAGAIAACVAGAITLAYLLPFRGYGLNFEDEGLILAAIQRVVDGQLPYVDFDTGYTPGYFYLLGAFWRVAGDVPTLRVLLAFVHAATVAGLALVTARVASPVLAVVVPLLYVSFIPVFPGGGCMFNIPYPAWFATFAWIMMAIALLRFVERRRRSALVAASLAAAAALATKPNAGVFALAATIAVVLLVETPAAAAGRASVVLWWALFAGLLVGPWVTLGGWPGTRDALAYLVPLAAALLALPTRARIHRAGLVGDVAVVVATFMAASLPWLAFFWLLLGTEGFLRDVLLLGSGAAQLYYVAYPAFEPWALLATFGVVALALAGLGVRAGRLRPGFVALAAVVAGVAGVVAIARVGVMPERLTWSLIWQLESAGFPLVLLTHVGGVAWIWRRRGTNGCEVPTALLLCALFMHLQLFPRADFAHLVTAAALTAAFAAFLLEWTLEWWAHGFTGGFTRAALPPVVTVVIATIVLRVSPSLAALWSDPGPRLPFGVAPVGVERRESAVFADLGAAATRLAAVLPPGGPSLAFPAGDVALFLTGARNPSPVSYFFPGRPDHREEAEIVDVLARTKPVGLLSLNSAFFVFDDAPSYYFLLRRWVRARYALRERSGRFDVLVAGSVDGPVVDSTHVPEEAGRRVVPLRTEPLATAASALLDLATDDDANVRRAAVTMLVDRLAAEPDDALETRIADVHLDRRREVLVLRTLRDTRDARASAYLFAAARHPDPRIANEALGAMFVTREQLIAGRYLPAGPVEPTSWPARAGLVRAVRTTLADAGAPPRASALAAELAGVLGDAESVPLLRARLGADAATAASAAASLARLAPAGLGCELVALLARPEPEMVALVPTTVLELAERANVRTATRACLARTISTSGPAREPAIWIAAVLADATFAPALRNALVDGTPAVRRAAAWALGEMPDDADTKAILARSAELDPDSLARRLAAGAAAKQDGRVPRAQLATGDAGGSNG